MKSLIKIISFTAILTFLSGCFDDPGTDEVFDASIPLFFTSYYQLVPGRHHDRCLVYRTMPTNTALQRKNNERPTNQPTFSIATQTVDQL